MGCGGVVWWFVVWCRWWSALAPPAAPGCGRTVRRANGVVRLVCCFGRGGVFFGGVGVVGEARFGVDVAGFGVAWRA